MADNETHAPLSADEREGLERFLIRMERWKRLLNSGAGGIATLRKELAGEVAHASMRLDADNILREREACGGP